MRAWENRPDTIVVDEPFYAHYLTETQLDHPGADIVKANQECDWKSVASMLTATLPPEKSIFYQKHMTHHMLPTIERAWMYEPEFVNVFLIRDPTEMITSLNKVLPRIELNDTGLPQQIEIFEQVSRRSDTTPMILDSKDVLNDPHGMLKELCRRIGIAFDERMLSWPAGPRDTDGVWAEWWYKNVEKSTGFGPYKAKNEPVPDELSGIHAQCMDMYEQLYPLRMTI